VQCHLLSVHHGRRCNETVIQKHVLTVCVGHRDETALLKNVQCNLLSVGYGTKYDETAIQKNVQCNSLAVGH
jgi:hypothetical protein